MASGLSAKAEDKQVNTLVYSMGAKAEDIFQAFSLSEEESKSYNTVNTKFESHFIKRRNTIFELAKFNRRVQQEGESVDDFIIDLYSLAEHCHYGQLHDEMVRDRIVVGIKDSKLSEKLQKRFYKVQKRFYKTSKILWTSYRTRRPKYFAAIPCCRLSFTKRFFWCQAIHWWNALPSAFFHDITTFSSNLFRHLLYFT